MNESIPTPEPDMLEMSPWDFDQTPNGWRKLQDAGQYLEAANLIRDYIAVNKEKIMSTRDTEKSVSLELLNFHRGQMLAVLGEEHRTEAIECFEQAFESDVCWNAYVSATIGFLEGDKEKIEQAIRTIEASTQEEKRQGNIGIVKNLKKALEEGVRDYQTPYSWLRAE